MAASVRQAGDGRGDEEAGCTRALPPKEGPFLEPSPGALSNTPFARTQSLCHILMQRNIGSAYPTWMSTCPDKFRGPSPCKKGG